MILEIGVSTSSNPGELLAGQHLIVLRDLSCRGKDSHTSSDQKAVIWQVAQLLA